MRQEIDASNYIVVDEYVLAAIVADMELIRIYQCFCDPTRLRILHLLTHGPLCVCHFQEILRLPQTKVSQHLAYLRERGLVECTRHQTWMIYRLPSKPSAELEANLKCLQDCAPTDRRFRDDLKNFEKVRSTCGWIEGVLEPGPARAC